MNRKEKKFLRHINSRINKVINNSLKSKKLFPKSDGSDFVPEWLIELHNIRASILRLIQGDSFFPKL